MSPAPGIMHAALREPWHSLHRQREAASFGVWVFIGSEVMFFAAALLGYATYRTWYSDAFAVAARESNIWYGTVNTAVLLTSSFTMAVAAEAAEHGMRRLMLYCLLATTCLGSAFLVIKGFEYHEDIGKHLVPGHGFRLHETGAQIFWAFYWLLTGVHVVHLTTGIVVVTLLAWQAWRSTRVVASPAFEGVALYWHLVDVVWIFLYPLIYLPGRST